MNNDQKYTLTISLTVEQMEELLKVVHLANQRLSIESHIKPEDVVLASINNFIPKYLPKKMRNPNLSPSNLHHLGSTQFPLKNKLKAFLEEKGIKPSTLAKAVNISTGRLSDILNNKNQPSLDVFLRIFYYLDFPDLDEILYRDA
ncbi:helix-turn-helix transcriptional regulator [Ammoniphilus sp. 3BR4]|uniref:helix-turn-helix transcriptional regulator n=1 Tax=Ammoniphilus sp. 3BR4 TaxID=3158265 RepID=UPI003466092A